MNGSACYLAANFTSSVSGGDENHAEFAKASVSGGVKNTASGLHAWVGGGSKNDADAENDVVVGGTANVAAFITLGPAHGAVVLGGRDDIALGNFSTVSRELERLPKKNTR